MGNFTFVPVAAAAMLAVSAVAPVPAQASGHEAVQEVVRGVDSVGGWINNMEKRLQDWANGEEPQAQPQPKPRVQPKRNADQRTPAVNSRPAAAPNPAREETRALQSALNGVGFDAGVADGIEGRRTRAAISDYQAHMGYPATGQLSAAQRSELLDAHARIASGAAADSFPEVARAEGPQGLLKALRDPRYADSFQPDPLPDPSPQPAPRIADANMPLPDAPQDQIAGAGGGIGDGLALPPALTKPDPVRIAGASMAEHCELTSGMTQLNLGPQLVGTLANADQALSEQFCDARAYAMTQGNGILDKLGGNPTEYVDFCRQMASRLQPAIDLVPSGDTKAVAVTAQQIMQPIFNEQMSRASTAGKICLGIGYRLDDASIALGAATMLMAAAELPYGEVLGHHARWGFGTNASEQTSKDWYVAAITAMEQGADPAFWPSKTAERNAIIKGAIGVKDDQFGALTLPLAGVD